MKKTEKSQDTQQIWNWFFGNSDRLSQSKVIQRIIDMRERWGETDD
jgi:hypothetical protein